MPIRFRRKPPSGSWKLGNARMSTTRRWVQSGYPWTGQFETIHEVREYLSQDKLDCLLCGRALKSLSMHLVRIHGISCDRYKEQFGIPYTYGLISADVSLIMAEKALARSNHKPFHIRQANEIRRPHCQAVSKASRERAETFRVKDKALLAEFGRRNTKFSQEVVMGIKHDLANGLTYNQVCNKYQVSRTTIKRARKQS